MTKLIRVGGTSAAAAMRSISRRDQIVDEADAPEFLSNAARRSASESFFALQHLSLNLVEPELELPTLVVERSEILGRILCAVGKRGQQDLRLEPSPLIANCTSDPLRGEVGIVAARLGRDLEFDKVVAAPQLAEHLHNGVLLCARQPLAI